MTKFMWNGIKVDGKLYTASYSKGGLVNQTEETLTIYANTYTDFPKIDGFQVENHTDMMTDYFEKDKIRVTPDNKFYAEVHAAWVKKEEHFKKLAEKRAKKWQVA